MSDLDRLRQEYKDRVSRLADSSRYSLENPAYRFGIENRRAALTKLLVRNGLKNLEEKLVLEIGCGSGGVLHEYEQLGIPQSSLIGIDLLFDRLEVAHITLPDAGVCNADGQKLPFPDHCFDFILQYTAFSSILDTQIKKNMAVDLIRALKLNGTVIWYDFWWNPTNRQTRGINRLEIRSLFPNCTFSFQKITLAPPITRRILSFSTGLANILESLKIFNTHFLVFIKPIANSDQ